MQASQVSIDQYAGTKRAGERALGDTFWLALHAKFEGNRTAASEWLGFKAHDSVGNAWIRLGIAAMGRDAPRKAERVDRYQLGADNTIDDLEAMYLAVTGAKEYALVVDWEVPNGCEEVKLVPIFDLHCGSAACDWERFVRLTDWIKENPDVRWFGGGDMFELCTKSSPGNRYDEALDLTDALRIAKKRIAPIAHQGCFCLVGNHDSRLLRSEDTNWNPVQELCSDLDIPFKGISTHVVYNIKRAGDKKVAQSYTHFAHHGAGCASTVGAAYGRLQKFMDLTTAELITVGHVHQSGSSQTLRQSPGNGVVPIGRERQLGVLCPSFLQYVGYPAAMGLRLSPLGVITIEFGVDSHSIHARDYVRDRNYLT
jgi:hypothetical protein